MRILKKYNEFVNNRINENEEPMISPEFMEDDEMMMDDDSDIDDDSDMDMEEDSNIIDGEEDFENEFEAEAEEEMEEEMEEEEGQYIGTKLMNELAEKLGTEVVDNKIMYNDTEINFFSEDEKFHIGKNKFETVDEVLEFLTGAGDSGSMDTEEDETSGFLPEPMEEERPFESKRHRYINRFKA
jgi:hypothetical protein